MYREISYTMTSINTLNLDLNKSKAVYSMFLPLGENSLIQLVDIFRSREDMTIIDTDLYYRVIVDYQGFIISFYSRGLILVEKDFKFTQLETLIKAVENTVIKVPALIEEMVTKYHLSLVEIIDDFRSIPIHKSIIVKKFEDIGQDLSGNNKESFLSELAQQSDVRKFIGDQRSISHRSYEDLIVGTKGSIIRSEDIKLLITYHAYIRSLHLFLAKAHTQIEDVWNSLNESDELVDDFEEYLKDGNGFLEKHQDTSFTEGRRDTLYKTKSHIIQGIKNIDHYTVLAKFIEESIEFTSSKYTLEKSAGRIKENSFHITKILQILDDRSRHLKILSESLINRGRSLRSRIELYDAEILYDSQKRTEKIASLETEWDRTLTHGIEKTGIDIDPSNIVLSNPEIICSLFVPLGENGIIRLVDDFQKRDNIKILRSDLYYHLEVQCTCHGYIFSFYSRGLITISVKITDCDIKTLIERSKEITKALPSHLGNLITKYQLSLIEVLGEVDSIPMHKTIMIDGFKNPPKDISGDDFLRALVENPIVKEFLGIPRSVDSREYEDVIIGTSGSIIRSDDSEFFLSYHAYNRALHLFLEKYNLEIETVWNDLNECDELVDEFEEYMRTEKSSVDIGSIQLFSTERHEKLSKMRFHIIREIKDIDHFIVITNFIEDSIGFSVEKFTELIESGKIKKNSFHIRKVLRTLKDRTKHLKILSESFGARAKTLVTRLELYDSEIAYETQQRDAKIANMEDSWRRTFTYGLEPALVKVNSNDVFIQKPSVIYSLYVPLGENGIVRLVDRFKSRADIKILQTDLYYHVIVKEGDFVISFYSRGLITIKAEFDDVILSKLLGKIESVTQEIPLILKRLLTKYHLSLIDIFGDIESVPIHKTIMIGSFPQNKNFNDNDRDQFLRGLSEDPKVSNFIGDPRSIDSQDHEDVLIGTEGSLVRSDDIETLISYHTYNRALHLFLEKYNLEIEAVWNTLQECEDLVTQFEKSMDEKIETKELGKVGMFTSDRRKNLRLTRIYVIQGIKNINSFIVMTNFIEESIEFTINKYSQVLESGIRQNSFHIRKVLRTLKDRVKHLKIVSENFVTQGNTLFSRLELYDSEIAFEIQQKIEKLAFIIGLIGIILAVVAIIFEVF